MAIQDVLTVFAVLALVVNALTLVVLGGRVVRWRTGRTLGVVTAMQRRAGELVALVSVGATLGSLYLSEIGHLIPCRYCWFQRVAMYPVALVSVIAVAKSDRNVRWYLLPGAAIGLAFSVWHYLLQVVPSLEDATACNLLNPCTVRYAWEFGFVSIPYMAGSVSLFILALLAGRHRASRIG